MYQVTLEKFEKNKRSGEKQIFLLENENAPDYGEKMEKLADVLFGLDVDFDDVDGEGDIMVDDILICVSEEETFTKKIAGRRCVYVVQGGFLED